MRWARYYITIGQRIFDDRILEKFMSTQLTLGIRLRDDATFNNFYMGRNQQVLHALRQLVASQGENFVFLWAEAGAGISHLLQACCHEVFQHNGNAIYLNLSEQQFTPDVLQDLETVDLICIDDIESILGQFAWEEGLLHLYNRVRESGARLVIGAKQQPKGLQCKLLDLKSRLAWGLVLKLNGLTAEEKLHALQMRAMHRGLVLSESTRQFLLRYNPDDTAALFNVLDKLDKASLAEKRKVTIPFIKQVLEL